MNRSHMKLKTFFVGFTILMLPVALANLAFGNFMPPIQHNSGVFIRPDGSVDPSTAPIRALGSVYTFTGDVSVGIAVQKSNIVIDGAGHSLMGKNSGTGVYLQSVNNVTVQGFTIQNFTFGFYLGHSNSSTIRNNTLMGCGISVTQDSYSNLVEGNNVSGDISVAGGSNNAVLNNNASRISNIFASNTVIANNRVTGTTRTDAKLLFTDDATGGGIAINNSDNCTISNNSIERQTLGINIWHSTNLNFSGNTLRNNQVGIKMWGADLQHNLQSIDTSNTIDGKPVYFLVNEKDFVVPNNAGWIAAINSNNITIQNWVSTPNWDGILFVNTNDSKIINSTLVGNFNAIRFNGAFNNEISHNTISNSGYAAFYFEETFYSTVSGNIEGNNFCAFYIWHNSASNTFLRNRFLSNTTGWADPVPNTWDDGREGNRWMNYSGVDQNGDGIGDTPYIINTAPYATHLENVDNFPIMLTGNDYSILALLPSAPPYTPLPNRSPSELPTPTISPSQVPSPSPTSSIFTPSPSPSPTQQPTLEPTPTAHGIQAENLLLIAIFGLVAFAAVSNVLFYFKRRKRRP